MKKFNLSDYIDDTYDDETIEFINTVLCITCIAMTVMATVAWIGGLL